MTKSKPIHPPTSPLATKLRSFVQLSDKELQCLDDIQSTPTFVERGTELFHQGEHGHIVYILQSGWGCSFKVLDDGARQIITFPVPGDCVGLHGVLLRASDHSFSALTDVIVSRVEIPRMLRIFSDFPNLGSAFLWATSRDEAMTAEHLASIGRRSAIKRTAHFFLELDARLHLVSLARDAEFDCPISQTELADALGLSPIHVNRVLRELREYNLLTFQNHKVAIHDRWKLNELAGYDDVEVTSIEPLSNAR